MRYIYSKIFLDSDTLAFYDFTQSFSLCVDSIFTGL